MRNISGPIDNEIKVMEGFNLKLQESMSIFIHKSEQFLPINIDKAWGFFSSAKNLTKITPPKLGFNILTQINDEKGVYEGMLIEYTLKPLLGIPIHWRTEINRVEKPNCFTDKQLKGPFKTWKHTHTFIEKKNGVLMEDFIRYELPFGMIGNILHKLVVRKKVAHIFAYRKEILKKIFKDGNNIY